MIIVRFKRNGGNVSVRINITGYVHWSYVFKADGYPYSGNHTMPGPFTHSLGFAHEVENDRNKWDISLANLSGSKQKYRIVISWHQDNNNLLDIWSVEGELNTDTNKAISHFDQAWLIVE